MLSNGENSEALDRLRSWQDAGVTIAFSLRSPSDARYDVKVLLRAVSDESIALKWLLFIGGSPEAPFVKTDGLFVVWLEGASVLLSDDRSSVLISRDLYNCVLKP